MVIDMKKIIAIVLSLLLICTSAWGGMYVVWGNKKPVVYSGTITGLRISAVDGTAFIDAASAITSYADGNHEISIYDTNGYKLVGVLKEAGSGETLGSELVKNGNMETGDPPTGWTAENGATLSSVADERTGGAGAASINCQRGSNNLAVSQSIIVATGGLHKTDYWRKNIDQNSGAIVYVFGAAQGTISASTDWNRVSAYYSSTSTSANVWLLSSNTTAKHTRYDDISVKQVTAPSTDGCTIVSTKGGTTYNFTSKHASFAYNAASYRVVVRKMR